MNHFSAGLEWPSGKVYLFQGDNYFGLDPATDAAVEGYPFPIAGNWPGVFASDIDAAILWNSDKAFFFKGAQYIRYDIASDRADEGYPRPIAGNWPGLFESDIDAAVMWGSEKAFFFKGDQYIGYDVATDRADDGYPRPIAGNWPGLFESDIDEAFNWTPGKLVFLKGDEYVLYDINTDQADEGYPRPIPTVWLTSASPVDILAEHPLGGEPELSPTTWETLPVRDRIVQACNDILAGGPMGHHLRADFYRRFINCGMTPAIKVGGMTINDLSPVKTSCAIFVRAIHHWCGRAAQESINSAGIFTYLQLSQAHPAWVKFESTNRPNPGDIFYVASQDSGVDGHVGIFLREVESDRWETAEGGGSDGPGGAEEGTLCRLSSQNAPPSVRSFRPGEHFDTRKLRGWFDCELLEFPPPN